VEESCFTLMILMRVGNELCQKGWNEYDLRINRWNLETGELGCVVEKDGEFEWMETERMYE